MADVNEEATPPPTGDNAVSDHSVAGQETNTSSDSQVETNQAEAGATDEQTEKTNEKAMESDGGGETDAKAEGIVESENNNDDIVQGDKCDDSKDEGDKSKVSVVREEVMDNDQEVQDSAQKADDQEDSKGSETDRDTKSEDSNIGNTKGAKILMNRFSTWRQKTNENAQSLWKQGPVIQENAKALWKQGPNISAMSRFTTGMRGGAKAEDKEVQASDTNQEKEPQFRLDGDSDAATSKLASPDNAFVAASGIDAEEEATKDDSSPDKITNDETGDQEEPRVRVGVALSKASAAASVVAESVATNFRGRYSGKAPPPVDTTPDPKLTRQKSSPESQTSLILKSRAAKHMQEIIDSLDSHEFVMLLGNGMLGVNLKQCYLKNHGVFVDFLVPGGQSELSGVVRTGDLLIKVGDIDIRKGTIAEIPQTIAGVKRPVVLILATGTKVPLERMNYIDVVVAMMHRARDYYNSRGTFDSFPSTPDGGQEHAQGSEEKQPENNVEGREQTDQVANDVEGKQSDSAADPSVLHSISNVTIPVDVSVDSFVTPPAPTLPVRKEFLDEVAQRCNDKFNVSGLCQVVELDKNFRAAVRNAFLTCAIDSRKLPYLARHFSAEDDIAGDDGNEGKMTPSAQLMLFLELMSFFDLYGVTPAARLRDVASRISHKFFLPNQIGDRLEPPLFDFHKIVPDSSLRHLEFVLSGNSSTIPCDVFLDFQEAVVEALIGAPFLSFLTSAECSRMRAFLRNTAPYVNLPLQELFDALVGDTKHSGAKNCFAYMLLYLICQQEREPAGEHDFTMGENHRLLAAASGITCAVFIQRVLMPTVSKAKKSLDENETQKELDSTSSQKLLQVFARFWDIFISPGVGALENFSKSNETETAYKAVRSMLEKADGSDSGDVDITTPATKVIVDCLLEPKLSDAITHLADELLYDYAARVHTKFREHKFHEWMCNELCKMKVGDRTWSCKQEVPRLPQGCIKRLLRKAELPEGVSSHKPCRVSETQDKLSENKQRHHNAEYAVVFGTSVGNDLAAQMPIPTIEKSDIRRYRCLDVANEEGDTFQEDPIPATFESYAVVPPRRSKPFAEAEEELRLSTDGYEVSLVNFIIPNGDSSSGDSTESALFGVSLVFQKPRSDRDSEMDDPIRTEIVCDDSVGDSKELHIPEKKTEEPEEVTDSVAKGDGFVSPISFETRKISGSENEGNDEDASEAIRKVSIPSLAPVLNQKVQGQPWLDRVLEDEYRDQEKPITIGLALVSRRNVILAMRETLSRLLHDFSRTPTSNGKSSKCSLSCGALIEVLGSFSYRDVENTGLRCILGPYLQAASSPWIDKPLLDQRMEFEKLALQQLTDCLPPTPLALVFVTALLEQRIVLSSSRRSILHSASVALATMLRPLTWSHLLVPLAPSALASDLIQYPAPFIIGIPSEDSGNMDLINNLPRDVTLVDLDVGRVILAPSFGQDNEMVRGTVDADVTATALRSQVLYLAQAIGTVFGKSLQKATWCCDSPSLASSRDIDVVETPATRLEKLTTAARRFIAELLEGSTSCCYWIEEASQAYGSNGEPTVLFDEDRFFHIKNLRATKSVKPLFGREKTADLALSLDDFDLVLESFLRCQSMSIYISSRPKTEMMYY